MRQLLKVGVAIAIGLAAGAVQAQQTQAELDAARQNTLKKNMQP